MFLLPYDRRVSLSDLKEEAATSAKSNPSDSGCEYRNHSTCKTELPVGPICIKQYFGCCLALSVARRHWVWFHARKITALDVTVDLPKVVTRREAESASVNREFGEISTPHTRH
jgi:hypothetical protein